MECAHRCHRQPLNATNRVCTWLRSTIFGQKLLRASQSGSHAVYSVLHCCTTLHMDFDKKNNKVAKILTPFISSHTSVECVCANRRRLIQIDANASETRKNPHQKEIINKEENIISSNNNTDGSSQFLGRSNQWHFAPRATHSIHTHTLPTATRIRAHVPK